MIHAMLLAMLADPCPVVTIREQKREHISQPYFYVALEPLPGGDMAQTYRWSVSKGDVVPGDYPRDTAVGLDLDELTRHDIGFDLTVEVGGLPEGCPHKTTQHFVERRYAGPPLAKGDDGAPCPRIGIDGLGSEHLTGEYFVARLDPLPPTPVGYAWSVTGGGKLYPKGDPRFAEVETELTELEKHDVSFDLTVEVRGLPRGCANRATQHVKVPRFEMSMPVR